MNIMNNVYEISAEELLSSPKIPITVKNNPYEIYIEFALDMICEVINNNNQNRRTVMICPCGPVEQYPIFARLVNQLRVDLKNTWIINMDEYLTDGDKRISSDNPFSFVNVMNENLYRQINPDLVMPKEQRIFPDPDNLDYIPKLIEDLGGVDIAFGGVALNGHVAFNEPEPNLSVEEFSNLPTRIVTLSAETRIKDAILSRGGAVDSVPTRAITIGMKEILGAKKIRLSMMNQMQRAVIRKACFEDASAKCPVSLLQNHSDAMLLVLKTVTEKPF